jgi:CheY-like chemotaxis protein
MLLWNVRALTTERNGLTLISVQALAKRAVRNGSEAPYQPDLAWESAHIGAEIQDLGSRRRAHARGLHQAQPALPGSTPSPSATTVPSGKAAALTGDYALVLLDLTLPGTDGLKVLREDPRADSRAAGDRLTARAAVQQRVEGLDRGANDYITQAVLLRGAARPGYAQLRSPSQRESSMPEATGIHLDRRNRRVERDGREVQLTSGSDPGSCRGSIGQLRDVRRDVRSKLPRLGLWHRRHSRARIRATMRLTVGRGPPRPDTVGYGRSHSRHSAAARSCG